MLPLNCTDVCSTSTTMGDYQCGAWLYTPTMNIPYWGVGLGPFDYSGSSTRIPSLTALSAVALVIVTGWICHAGLDWDWQTPAATTFVFALAGTVSAKSSLSRSPSDDLLFSDRCDRYSIARKRLSIGDIYRPGLAILCVGLAILPARTALAHRELNEATAALGAGRCTRASTSARNALRTLDTGPEARDVLAVCAAREGHLAAAVGWARSAVKGDPHNWEPNYVLALVQGAAGQDPRRTASIAESDYPLNPFTNLAISAFGSDRPRSWQRAAQALPFAFN
jgi:hypothetical protein